METADGILLDTNELAERWHMSAQSLINWRSQRRGPPFIRGGRRSKGRRPSIRYRLAVIQAYETEHLIIPTGKANGKNHDHA